MGSGFSHDGVPGDGASSVNRAGGLKLPRVEPNCRTAKAKSS